MDEKGRTNDAAAPFLEGGKPTTHVSSLDGAAAVGGARASHDVEKRATPDSDAGGEAMGYKQELRRNLSMWTALGLGASIIAAPFGLSTSASFSLVNGGTASYIWGWLFLSIISVCIAASLGEIASVFPTSGGIYVWTAYLAPRRYSALASFIVGWISLVANIL